MLRRRSGSASLSSGTRGSGSRGQLALALPCGWGGSRAGAGRRPAARRNTPHLARPVHKAGHPVHVTLRSRLTILRWQSVFETVTRAIARSSRADFRVVHFSVQRDHVHLLVEAHDKDALSRGMRGLAVRAARRVNAAIGTRGPVWSDRWNGRALRSPREVRDRKSTRLNSSHRL